MLKPESVDQLEGELCLLCCIEWVVAGSAALQGTLAEAKSRAVIGNDGSKLCQRRGDEIPRECAGTEPVQQEKKLFAMPICLVVKPYSAHIDELAVLVCQLIGGLSLVGMHGDEKRSANHQRQEDSQRECHPVHNVFHYGCFAIRAKKPAVACTTRCHCSAGDMTAA